MAATTTVGTEHHINGFLTTARQMIPRGLDDGGYISYIAGANLVTSLYAPYRIWVFCGYEPTMLSEADDYMTKRILEAADNTLKVVRESLETMIVLSEEADWHVKVRRFNRGVEDALDGLGN